MINTAKRRELIIDQLCREGTVRVEQLSQQFSVSSVTIRSDLRQLEKHGCAVRAYGGAMLNKQFAFDRPLQDKGRLNRDVKHVIACAAAALIEDGDAVILDSGSTTSQMAPQLAGKKDLVVMTNAPPAFTSTRCWRLSSPSPCRWRSLPWPPMASRACIFAAATRCFWYACRS